jgi:hypothetical protein
MDIKMAHFAEINEDNVVINVVVVDNKFLLDDSQIEQESLGIEHLKSVLGQEKTFVQTSYNTIEGLNKNGGTPIRKNYAGIGMIYNEELDAFITPKPFPSWILNEDKAVYFPPVPYPSDGGHWIWNEEILSWEPLVPVENLPEQ